MSKLFKLKKWLTLDEAASHISNVLGEPATVADLYRFALDGHLTLSVDFVNHAKAKKGKWVKSEQVEFITWEHNIFTGEKLDIPHAYSKNNEIQVSEDDWIKLEQSVVSISGIWDLTMVGAEKLDIEHNYQQLTSVIAVTLVALEGVFVQQGDVVCQLQDRLGDNDYSEVSKDLQEGMERHITTNNLSDSEAKKLREKFNADREKYLENKKNKSKESDYYPAGGLPDDCVLVVRTKEITRFIQSLEETPEASKPLTSKERNSLLVLIGAMSKALDVDLNERGIASYFVKLTEELGAPLTDDTIRKILNQIENAVDLRTK
ncbi:MAG: hypothetical protein OEY59_10905 [Deltaproteobacteria bacterium]|nr:hypothetical protein [Deltaproteobacteria bacterium]